VNISRRSFIAVNSEARLPLAVDPQNDVAFLRPILSNVPFPLCLPKILIDHALLTLTDDTLRLVNLRCAETLPIDSQTGNAPDLLLAMLSHLPFLEVDLAVPLVAELLLHLHDP